MPRKPLQLLGHVEQILCLLIRLIELTKIRYICNCLSNRNILLHRNRLGDRIHIGIRHIKNPADITDHSSCRHRTKGDDLRHMISAVFAGYIIDDLLPSLIAKIHVDIGHGHTLRV